ncbi:hypothetical protein NM36_2071 [Neisseria meningitidis NM36]|nr:hypothetical protein NM36_2071 [Neisseria meningitidis NM36]
MDGLSKLIRLKFTFGSTATHNSLDMFIISG